MALSHETLRLFGRASTATLTTQLFKRGLRNVFVQGVQRMSRPGPVLVGEAFTLRYIPAREDLDMISVFENPQHPQRKAIETVPPGQVLVMDCRRDTRAASGGSILLTRLKVRGAAGIVTDGGLRDSEAIATMDFPVFGAGGSAPLNLAIHHAVDLNVPIGCGGVAVFPGDVIVGDGEGVVVVPKHLAEEVARDAAEQEIMEEFVTQEIAGGRALPGTYPPNAETLARYRVWREQRDKKP
ncbi:MAG TPA: ribonuclease activity regulator RraA [Casimicrobiaceae bacterium]|nr:ribonuclease activity regulator RraA [Casimicrobiaceae bacterium]